MWILWKRYYSSLLNSPPSTKQRANCNSLIEKEWGKKSQELTSLPWRIVISEIQSSQSNAPRPPVSNNTTIIMFTLGHYSSSFQFGYCENINPIHQSYKEWQILIANFAALGHT
ncbi:hypothetical protein STEG23_024153 [Scotinomys teguina]